MKQKVVWSRTIYYFRNFSFKKTASLSGKRPTNALGILDSSENLNYPARVGATSSVKHVASECSNRCPTTISQEKLNSISNTSTRMSERSFMPLVNRVKNQEFGKQTTEVNTSKQLFQSDRVGSLRTSAKKNNVLVDKTNIACSQTHQPWHPSKLSLSQKPFNRLHASKPAQSKLTAFFSEKTKPGVQSAVVHGKREQMGVTAFKHVPLARVRPQNLHHSEDSNRWLNY